MNFIRNNKPALIIVILIIVGSMFGLVIFSGNSSNSRKISPSKTAITEPQFQKEGILHIVNADETDTIVSLDIEIADNEYETTRGLMYRKTMGDEEGMLFIFPYEEPRSFWMKNTVLSLDIMYADANGVLVSCQKFTKPFSEASLPSAKPAQFVLEVKAGFWDKYKLEPGYKIVFNRL